MRSSTHVRNGSSGRRGPTPRHGTTSTRGAFTLVELLVVIGIIALLISILLPALNRARAQANTTVCKSNLKSIGQTIMIYVTQSKGSLPIGQMDRNVSIGGQNVVMQGGGTNWVLLLENTMNPRYGATWDEALATHANDNKIRDLFLCPEGPKESDKNATLSAVTHYACHPYLMPQYTGNSFLCTTSQTPRVPYKMSQIRQSSEKALIADASLYFDSTTNTWHQAFETPVLVLIDNNQITDGNTKLFLNWRTPIDRASPPINLDDSIRMKPSYASGGAITAADVNADSLPNANNVRFRHLKNTSCNVLMADGHVESFSFNPRMAMTKPSDPKVSDFTKRHIFINFIP